MNMLAIIAAQWRRRFSLVAKMLILTTVAGGLSWLVLDRVFTQRVEELFSGQLLELLSQQSSEDRLLLHEFLSFHSWAVTLLVRHENFIRYVQDKERTDWLQEPASPVLHQVEKPHWLPGRSITRKLAFASYILLLDKDFRMREIHSQTRSAPSDESLEEALALHPRTDGQHVLTHIGDELYLITLASLRDGQNNPRAHLAFVAPFDDELLYSFQQQYRSMGIVVFIDNESNRVVASSRPDLVAKGMPVADLEKNYDIAGKKFFDYGFTSDTNVRFATLISLSNLAHLSQSVLAEERIYRGLAHLGLTLLFLIIAFWISRRLAQLVHGMEVFARDRLGLTARPIQVRDQLERMKQQFDIMAEEIVLARERDMAHARALEKTNQALSDSLEVIQKAQVQLVRAEKLAALGGLVAGISHEINTPAGIAFTSSTYLEEETQAILKLYQAGNMRRSDLENYLDVASESASLIQNNLNRATQLIRNFKMVAVDQASGERRSFNLGEYLEGVVLSLRPKLKKTRVEVDIQCPPDLILDSYPGAFSQIVTNLIMNTLTHGYEPEDPGWIHMQVARQDGRISLVYEDGGRGVAAEHLSRIFDPFFTTIRGRGGSGLGLHIVHNLVTQTLQGSLTCASEPGKGLSFTIIFTEGDADAVG